MTYCDIIDTCIFCLLLLWSYMDRMQIYFPKKSKMAKKIVEWFVKPRFPGSYSLLGATNILFFQWFFVRLEGYRDWPKKERDKWKFRFIGPICPLTGWWSNYVWLKKIK